MSGFYSMPNIAADRQLTNGDNLWSVLLLLGKCFFKVLYEILEGVLSKLVVQALKLGPLIKDLEHNLATWCDDGRR